MAYTAQTWVDGNATYPLSAARMTNIENGLVAAAGVADLGQRSMTTATRDGLASPTTGTMIWNTTTSQYETYNGSAWVALVGAAWTAYTPTLTNTTAPITVARYNKVGRSVSFYVVLTLTGAQVTGLVGITLPVTAANQYGGEFTAVLEDTGTIIYTGAPYMATTGRIDVYALNAGTSYAAYTATSATIPHTWASTDRIILSGTYESAA